MKKILASLITMIVLSVNAFALTGTVTQVEVQSNGTIKVKVDTYNKPLVGTPEAIKAMYAAALTAKTSGAQLTVAAGDHDGTAGWALVIIQ